MGIQPDIIVCRSKQELEPKVREKISLYCNVPIDHVISSPDADNIYTLPALFQEQRLTEISTSRLRLNMPYPSKDGTHQVPFAPFVRHAKRHCPALTIAVTLGLGKSGADAAQTKQTAKGGGGDGFEGLAA